jgi:hypothetical protein
LDFQNDYTVLPSTLGNPNFLAAFVSASFFAGVYILASSRLKIGWIAFVATLSIISSLYIVAASNSLQGPLGIALGVLNLIFMAIVLRNPILTLAVSVFLLIASFPLIQGLFGKGLFGDRLEQGTLVVRSMYWGIAARIGMDSPILGNGFDTYLDNYRKFRSSDEVLLYGTGLVSDSPHNLFLDFFVAGGFPYLFWAIAGSFYVFLVAIRTVKLLRLEEKPYWQFISIYTIWLVFFLLSLINPFQLAVNIWNVILGFLIIGHYHQLLLDYQKDSFRKDTKREKEESNGLFVRFPLVASLILFVNPVFAALPISTEIRFRSAVEDSDYLKLRAVSMDWPFSGSRVAAITQGINDSSLKQSPTADLAAIKRLQDMVASAHADALAATRINGESFDLWRFIFYNHPDPLVREKARKNLVRLDPQETGWETSKP